MTDPTPDVAVRHGHAPDLRPDLRPGPPLPADPDRLARNLARWREAGGAAEPLIDHPVWGAPLRAAFGGSPFLTQVLLADPSLVSGLAATGPEAVLAECLAHAAPGPADEPQPQLMARLRRARTRAAATIALADLASLWDLAAVTGALSSLAETAVRAAVRQLLGALAARGRIAVADPAAPEAGSGLIVLGMGKLGARELNYSSDIDLIVLYDDEVARPADPTEASPLFSRLARDLVRIMEERTADGYVFRTDLRLRPDPSATPPAVSVSAAEAYYGSMGQNWERAAMIKARPIAGDLAAGEAFLSGLIRPWVFRRSLDFAAIQDIHSIKRQIHSHKIAGDWDATAQQLEGTNVKLGRGGIREIEFFAQTQQLIYGGRDPRLRVAPTEAALAALVGAGRVAEPVRAELVTCYRALRRLEHRIQMVDDRQTHELPREPAAVDGLARFFGYGEPAAFRRDLAAVLGCVAGHYGRLFEEAEPLGGATGSLIFTGSDPDPGTLATLGDMGFRNARGVAEAIMAWHHGRYRATRSTRARELMTELVPRLLADLATTPDPDQSFARFDSIVAALPAGVPLFSMLAQNPRLLDLLVRLIGVSKFLADHVRANPSVLEAVLTTEGFGDALPGRAVLAEELGRLLGCCRDYEDRLETLRRWSRDKRFQAGVQILEGKSDGDSAGPFLSDVADLALSALLPAVEAEFARVHGRVPGAELALVALGRLGSRVLHFGSDLDVLFVWDAPPDAGESDGRKPLAPQYWFAGLVRWFLTAVTAQTAEGRLADLDLRLRPHGDDGPLASHLPTMLAYYDGEAWTWERMVLTRARVVTATSPDLAARVSDGIRRVLTRPRDGESIRKDVADMRQKVLKQYPPKGEWDIKYCRGGFVDIEFTAQYLMLRHAHAHPSVLHANMADALLRLAAAGLLDAADATDLVATIRTGRRVQGVLRMMGLEGGDPDLSSAPVAAALARAVAPEAAPPLPAASLEAALAAAHARALRIFERVVEGRAP